MLITIAEHVTSSVPALVDALTIPTTSPVPTDVATILTRFGIAIALGILIGSERERSTNDHSAPGVRTFTILTLAGAVSILFGPIALAAVVLAAAAVTISPLFSHTQHRTDRAKLLNAAVLENPDATLDPTLPDTTDPTASNEPSGISKILVTGGPGYGATTIAAATTAPLIGALALLMPAAAAAVAVAITITLITKQRLHTFIRTTVTPTELTDALKFFIIALIILPLLPDTTLDPLGVINPHKIGILVTALTGIGWLGYIAVRTLGAKRGLPLAGLAGGFVSSTATTVAMARRGRIDILRRPAISAALLSKISSLGILILLVGAIDSRILIPLAPPVLVLAASVAFLAWWLVHNQTPSEEAASITEEHAVNPQPNSELPDVSDDVLSQLPEELQEVHAKHRGKKHKDKKKKHPNEAEPSLLTTESLFATEAGEEGIMEDSDTEEETIENDDPVEDDRSDNQLDIGRPFALKPALILAAIITVVLFASKAAAALLGSGAVIAVAAITGVAETQAPAVAAADLAKQGTLTPAFAMLVVVAALLTNTLMKVILGFTAGGKKTGLLLASMLIPPAILMTATALVTYYYLTSINTTLLP